MRIKFGIMQIRLHTLPTPKKGCFLLADAYLGDTNFDRSVILITEHNRDGSLGFVVNRPIDIPLKKMLPEFPLFDASVFNGGPVEKDHLYYLHNKGELVPNSQLIREGLYWGGDYEVLQEMVVKELIGPDDIYFYLGYSGWNWGQLKQEIQDHSWEVVEPENLQLRDLKSDDLWTDLMRNTRTEASYWHTAPKDPQWN